MFLMSSYFFVRPPADDNLKTEGAGSNKRDAERWGWDTGEESGGPLILFSQVCKKRNTSIFFVHLVLLFQFH